ncbi:MAG: hypothetical protein JSS27_04705 [Planctomycetes bacterium]|nr:hypothetical protein [Planctomycetota bacterium]
MATVVHKEADVLDRIWQECEDDYVGLWSIYRQAKEAGLDDPKLWTLAIVSFLLHANIVQAGAPDDQGGFIPWKSSPDDAWRRIASEWQNLQREPDIGDIVWFTTPATSHRP